MTSGGQNRKAYKSLFRTIRPLNTEGSFVARLGEAGGDDGKLRQDAKRFKQV